jgi:hypothetical protein
MDCLNIQWMQVLYMITWTYMVQYTADIMCISYCSIRT